VTSVASPATSARSPARSAASPCRKPSAKDGRWYPEFFPHQFLALHLLAGCAKKPAPPARSSSPPDYELCEYNRQDLVYEKEDLMISGTGQVPGLQLLPGRRTRQSRNKPKGAAENEAQPVDVKGLSAVKRAHGHPAQPSWVLHSGHGRGVCDGHGDHERASGARLLLHLVVSLLAVAGMFFRARARPFAGFLEVMSTAGAIMVLFVFVVMMLNLGESYGAAGTHVADAARCGIGPAPAFGNPLRANCCAMLQFAAAARGGLAARLAPSRSASCFTGPYLLGVETGIDAAARRFSGRLPPG